MAHSLSKPIQVKLTHMPLKPQRLDKYLYDRTSLHRRTIMKSIYRGEVSYQTREMSHPLCIKQPQFLIFPEDRVWIRHEEIGPPKTRYYLILHKPFNVLSISRDICNRPSLKPWLDLLPPGIGAVGRLDKATTGLLLLTNDGDLSFGLTSPKHGVLKRYKLWIKGTLDREDPRFVRLSQGLLLRDGFARAIDLSIVHRKRDHTEVELSLDEGRKRQIRRMCQKAGLSLMHLHRISIGPISLGSLEPGALRPLTVLEVKALWDALGGYSKVYQRAWKGLEKRAQFWRANGTPHLRLEQWLQMHPL